MDKKKDILVTVLPIIGLIVFLIFVSLFSLRQMSKSLYDEQVGNSNRVMEKIAQNVETGIQGKWDTIHYLSEVLAGGSYRSTAAIQAELGGIEANLGEMDCNIFLVDENGLCYASGGRTFKWERMSMLSPDTEEIYVSTLPSMGRTGTQLFFLSRMRVPLEAGDTVMTHLCLVCNMDSLDVFFDMEDYGEQSMAFVLRKDGSQLYRQEKNNPLAGSYNILAMLEQGIYQYGTSYEKLEQDIKNETNDCVSVIYKGRSYFVAYRDLQINDWIVLMMIPKEYVGAGTVDFMRTIIWCIAAISTAFLLVLAAVILRSAAYIRRKQEAVNAQLMKAAEAEKNANIAKTQFLSSMSHDIRTPMNAIIGMTTIASRHPDDPVRIKECLDKVTLASNHLLTLINDILDISKVESGKMTLNPVVFSLAESATNLANIVRPQVTAKSQSFDIRIHNIENEYLYADGLRLNQVFINLLTNAVKYTPEGGSIVVDIKEEAVESRKDAVRLIYMVADSGIGMTTEYQKTMYDSFTRAADSRVDKIQGSGLGLSICRQMVELMGGHIECKSVVNQGTTFTVTVELPVADKRPEELTLPPMDILIVDDDEIFLESATDMFLSLGVSAECAGDGKEAVSMAKEKHNGGLDYQVIIVDWKMPEMDGVETIEALRGVIGKDTSLLIVSSYDWTEIEEIAKEAGADGFINKPFFRSTVYYSLNELMHFDKEKAAPEEDAAEDLAGMHLLIAEDNDINWEIIWEILNMYDISAERAENGKICADKMEDAQQGAYDLILMDIQMPVMDGRTAAGKIRKSERKWVREIPIIAMTADAFAEDIKACLEAGMNGHVAKPVDVKKLLKEIRKALKEKQGEER